MKNWNRFFAAILTTALVAGCGKDNPGNNNVDPEDSKKAAYMSISVALCLRPKAHAARPKTAAEAPAERKSVRTKRTT